MENGNGQNQNQNQEQKQKQEEDKKLAERHPRAPLHVDGNNVVNVNLLFVNPANPPHAQGGNPPPQQQPPQANN